MTIPIERIRENYRSLDNEELVEIFRSGDVTDEALLALTEELSARGISPDSADGSPESHIQDTDDIYDRVPPASAPMVWIGFLFAGMFLAGEFVEAGFVDGEGLGLVIRLSYLGSFIYWLFCVHRIHKILQHISHDSHNVSPAAAVGFHFVPVFNLAWFFIWPMRMSTYLRQKWNVGMAHGFFLGLLLISSILVGRFFDGAIGLACLFSVTVYLVGKVRRAVKVYDAQSVQAGLSEV